jgi:hypothetical protein
MLSYKAARGATCESGEPAFLNARVGWALKRLGEADGTVLAWKALRDPSRKKYRFAGLSWMARPGLEPGTPRFSGTRIPT